MEAMKKAVQILLNGGWYLCGRNGKGGETVRDEELLQNLLQEIRETTQEEDEFLPAEGMFQEELEEAEEAFPEELEDGEFLPAEVAFQEFDLPAEQEVEDELEDEVDLPAEQEKKRRKRKLSKEEISNGKVSKEESSNSEVSKEESSNSEVSKEEMNNRELLKKERNNGKLSNKKRSNKKLSKREDRKRQLSKAERKNSNLSKEQSSNEEFSEEEERLDSDIYEVPVHNYYSVLSGKEDMDRSPLKSSSQKSERKTANKKRGRGGRRNRNCRKN
ncbi:nucleolar protein 58-like [Palaemon carinicauda]|uniref:nucleolar protein 58-like n=2 Tax=Palaemon carinicauda TaxID=392227 RepID=UPI0035B59612